MSGCAPRTLATLGFALAVTFATAPVASACACCGVDDSWLEESRTADGFALLPGATLATGTFSDGAALDYFADITAPAALAPRTEFRIEDGVFAFVMDGTVEQRSTDISFVTRPDACRADSAAGCYSDEADILHQWIYPGTLHAPGDGMEPTPARLILQGLGNGCVQAGTFRKWLIKPVGAGEIQASGTIHHGKTPRHGVKK